MPISDDAARTEQIREVASLLAQGLQRLFNSRDSVSQSLRDALSFRDKPCSVSSTLVIADAGVVAPSEGRSRRAEILC